MDTVLAAIATLTEKIDGFSKELEEIKTHLFGQESTYGDSLEDSLEDSTYGDSTAEDSTEEEESP